jgi:hypothetical protein
MAISAPGVGSGLDVNSIVTQLVAIERQPLQPLQTKATTFQAQLSLYGKIKSKHRHWAMRPHCWLAPVVGILKRPVHPMLLLWA